ncbi:MAG: NTPase [Desulfurococcus sp.]|nr:NTPase [Desulfurococcus sp.]
MHPPRVVITGPPGSGKSTLFSEIINSLVKAGLTVGGVRAPEVRVQGYRIGFKVIDILSGEEAWLARKNAPGSVRVGSYTVLVDEASRIMSKALTRALDEADVIGIDEVGPMELKIPVFTPLLYRVLDSTKPLILVVHYKLRDPVILGKLGNADWISVTIENREALKASIIGQLVEKIAGYVKHAKGC